MKRIITGSIVCVVLFTANASVAQMYTVTGLGTLGGPYSAATGINNSGQVVGESNVDTNYFHAFRTAPNSRINPATDDLGTLGGLYSTASAVNDSGQVAGSSFVSATYAHAFRTAPNKPINPSTDDLGTLGGRYSGAANINASGQVVGASETSPGSYAHGFRTAPNGPINPSTDDLGTLGGRSYTSAMGINDSGQVVGSSFVNTKYVHAFRTAANKLIDPDTDDLGTLGGLASGARGINAYGQVIGWFYDVSTGTHGFLYTGGVMHDLNDLIPLGSGCCLGAEPAGINDAGQIAATGWYSGQYRAFLLNPVYKAFVQQPLNIDGSSVFKSMRRILPVKFTLTEKDVPTCTLPAATIAVTRTAGGTLGPVGTGTFSTAHCQYLYHLATSTLGVGSYRVDINIEGIMIGHAWFALK